MVQCPKIGKYCQMGPGEVRHHGGGEPRLEDNMLRELLSNLVEIPFQANCRSVRRSRHPVDLATL